MGRPRKRNKYVLNLQDEFGLYGYGICYNTGAKFYFDMTDFQSIQALCWIDHEDKRSKYHELRAYIPELKKPVKMTTLFNLVNFDHIDHNPLNNRRCNLRKSTVTENNQNASIRKDNSSGIIGVNWNAVNQYWVARISVNGKRVFLGNFLNKDDAIKARLAAEMQYLQEFAPQKHLYKTYLNTQECNNDQRRSP